MKCVLCEEVITNPLCPCCLNEEAQQWLKEQGQDALANETHWISSGLVQNGSTNCIKCKNPMAVCTYCTTQDMMHVVKHNKRLLEQYLVYFNFDLGHMGWEQEALVELEVPV